MCYWFEVILTSFGKNCKRNQYSDLKCFIPIRLRLNTSSTGRWRWISAHISSLFQAMQQCDDRPGRLVSLLLWCGWEYILCYNIKQLQEQQLDLLCWWCKEMSLWFCKFFKNINAKCNFWMFNEFCVETFGHRNVSQSSSILWDIRGVRFAGHVAAKVSTR